MSSFHKLPYSWEISSDNEHFVDFELSTKMHTLKCGFDIVNVLVIKFIRKKLESGKFVPQNFSAYVVPAVWWRQGFMAMQVIVHFIGAEICNHAKVPTVVLKPIFAFLVFITVL